MLEEVREARTPRRSRRASRWRRRSPRAADRTELMCSVATRSPLSSSVIRWSGRALAALGVPVAAAAGAARGRGRGPRGGRRRHGRCGRRHGADGPPPPPPPPPPLTEASSSTDLPAMSGSSARRRPIRPRSRSTSTTRTAISSPLLSTSSTVSTRWPGDTLEMCSRPSVPLASSTNAPKVVVLTTLPWNESPTSTSLVIERMRSIRASPCGAGLRVDEDVAVVVDVDLRVELLAQAADRLAALADEQADLVGVDLDRRDPRGELRELAARRVDHLGHLAEDERAALLGLRERVAQDVEGDARDLDVHLQRGDARAPCRRP